MPEGIAPEQPRWYTSPRDFEVPVEQFQRGPFAEEVAILVRLDGDTKTAIVPASAVDEEKKVVKASIVGEIGDFILVSLPPSSMGRTTLQMSRAIFEDMVAKHES